MSSHAENLGLIGKAAGCVDSYNSKVVDAMIQKFQDGSESLAISGDALNLVIKNYDKTEVVNKQAILGVRQASRTFSRESAVRSHNGARTSD